MRKFISVLLVTDRKENSMKNITIESERSLHELEVYSYLEKLCPAFIKVNYDDESTQEGYSYKYLNGLLSVVIYRIN